MAEDDLLENRYLFRSRGEGTGWVLRIETPKDLIGRESAKTGRAYRKNIHEGLGTRDLKLARKRRDIRLGEIRAEEAKIQAEKAGDIDLALKNADAIRRMRNPVVKGIMQDVVEVCAEVKLASTVGAKKAQRWHDNLGREKIPVSIICENTLRTRGSSFRC